MGLGTMAIASKGKPAEEADLADTQVTGMAGGTAHKHTWLE